MEDSNNSCTELIFNLTKKCLTLHVNIFSVHGGSHTTCGHTHTDTTAGHTVTDKIQHPSELRQVQLLKKNPKIPKCLIQCCCRRDIRHGYTQVDVQTSTAHFEKRTEVMGKGDVEKVAAIYNTENI